jgi:hypothetical protein
MGKRVDTRLVMRWLPLYELCLYSGSCNRAAGVCDVSQATLNRAHRAIVELLEECQRKKLRDLLATLRIAAQKLRTAESLCRIEVDPFLPVTSNGGDLQIERWLRHKSDLTTSLKLLGERISDVFVGSLYELELERSRKLLKFQGKPLVAEALIRTPLWRIGPLQAEMNDPHPDPTLSLPERLQHPRLISRLKTLGYRIETTATSSRDAHAPVAGEVISHLQLNHQPIPDHFGLLDPNPIEHDVIGIVYSASYADEQPYFKDLMAQLTLQLRHALQAETELATKQVMAKMP